MKESRRLRVLVVGPGSKAQGGINSIIELHTKTYTWTRYQCRWIESFNGGSSLRKLCTALRAWGLGLFLIPCHQIVHIHLTTGTSLFRKLPFVLWGAVWRRPVILHFNASDLKFRECAEADGGLHKRALTLAMRLCSCVIAVSDSWKALIHQYYAEARVEVIPNPAIPLSESASLPNWQPTVLFLGKLEPRKGYEELIRAFAHVQKSVPSARLILAGHGQVEHARRLIEELEIGEFAQAIGWVDRMKRDDLLRNAGVLCLPSYGEGMSVAVLEAMAMGIPAVTTPVGGTTDFIQDGENGFLCEPGNVQSLATVLERVLSSEDLARRVGRNGLQTCRERFALQRVADQLSELYSRLGES